MFFTAPICPKTEPINLTQYSLKATFQAPAVFCSQTEGIDSKNGTDEHPFRHVSLLSNAPLSTCLLPPVEEGSKPPLELVICARGGFGEGGLAVPERRGKWYMVLPNSTPPRSSLWKSLPTSLSLPRHPGLFRPSPVICHGF